MKKKKIITGVQCPDCEKRLFSFHVHDFKFCGCPNETFVDGGTDYLRYGWSITKPKEIKWNTKLDGKYPVVKLKDYFPY